MCGIVGAIADRDVVPVLIEGLKRLEYRGYDSAGIAVVQAGDVRRVRRTGRVSEMEGAAASEGFSATLGIGHTRWATHGGVTEGNAHPHISHGDLALVHNGIIENHEAQREKLTGLGYAFESQTDTEVIAHLIHHHRAQGLALLHLVASDDMQSDGASGDGVQRGAVGGDYPAIGGDVADQVATGDLGNAHPVAVERTAAGRPADHQPCGQQQHGHADACGK